MRHLKQGRKLNRRPDIRNAMMRNMLTSLFRYERIEVTVPRAKELRILADKMVTLGKDGTLHARRQALTVMPDKEVTHKLFSDIAERNKERKGGYTRIIKTRNRYGDCAPMAFIELVEREAAAV
ncbi:MAG: 50S ribosomal protein L17 [Magnetococcales bacterium]|nr:50S ribosomal protein L17 [Magnetococcales bacterium]